MRPAYIHFCTDCINQGCRAHRLHDASCSKNRNSSHNTKPWIEGPLRDCFSIRNCDLNIRTGAAAAPAVGERLAFTGAVKDDIVDIELLAMRLLALLAADYPKQLAQRYRFALGEADGLDAYGLLRLVGKKRGMLAAGGEVNTERAAITVLDEFRSGKLGKFTLEVPPEK